MSRMKYRAGRRERRVVAVDGKTLPGSAHGGQPGVHPPAALDHAHGAVPGQVDVGARTSEIALFTALLDRVDTGDAVVRAAEGPGGYPVFLNERLKSRSQVTPSCECSQAPLMVLSSSKLPVNLCRKSSGVKSWASRRSVHFPPPKVIL
jgi:hypothetical protein